jgi:hypothetical protein
LRMLGHASVAHRSTGRETAGSIACSRAFGNLQKKENEERGKLIQYSLIRHVKPA